MVYLILRATIRRHPCPLIKLLVRKQCSTNHQLIYLTEVRPPLTIVINLSSCFMSTHQLLSTHVVRPHLDVEVSHIYSRHLHHNCRYLFIEVNLRFLCCFICWGIVLYDSDLLPPRVEPGLDNPRRHWFLEFCSSIELLSKLTCLKSY